MNFTNAFVPSRKLLSSFNLSSYQISYIQSTFEVGQDYLSEGASSRPSARSLVATTGTPENAASTSPATESETTNSQDSEEEWYDGDDLFDSQV